MLVLIFTSIVISGLTVASVLKLMRHPVNMFGTVFCAGLGLILLIGLTWMWVKNCRYLLQAGFSTKGIWWECLQNLVIIGLFVVAVLVGHFIQY